MSGKPAVRLFDIGGPHGCFPPTPIITGSTNVLVNQRPAARIRDAVLPHGCPVCAPHSRNVGQGSQTVLINNRNAARIGDRINCGGVVITGSNNVIVGG